MFMTRCVFLITVMTSSDGSVHGIEFDDILQECVEVFQYGFAAKYFFRFSHGISFTGIVLFDVFYHFYINVHPLFDEINTGEFFFVAFIILMYKVNQTIQMLLMLQKT